MVVLPVEVWRCLAEQAVDVLLKMCERVSELG